MDPGSSRRRASGHSQAQPRHCPQRGRAAVTGAAETTSVNPVNPVNPVAPVNPVNPVEGPADTAGLSDSGGGSSRFPGRPIQEIVFPTREQYLSVVRSEERRV